MERSSLVAARREKRDLRLEPHKVESAGPIVRMLASVAFYSYVIILRRGIRRRCSPVILGFEDVGAPDRHSHRANNRDLHADFGGPAKQRAAELAHGLAYDLCVLTGYYRGRTHGDCRPCAVT